MLSHEQIGEKIQETIDLGGTGVLLQGGVHAELPFSFYEEMFRFIRTNVPDVHLHALSAPEVYFLQKITKRPMRDVIARLKDAGLQSIPGGGAEILEDSVRKRIWSLTKAPTEKWVDVHESGAPPRHAHDGDDDVRRGGDARAARRAPARSCATCRTGPGGFTAWIPWTFQEENTALDGKVDEAGGFEYLKTLAVSRLFLDNVAHVQGSWVTQGAEDRPGVARLRRRRPRLDHDRGERRRRRRRAQQDGQDEMRRVIADAGYTPVQRRTLYDACKERCCTGPIPEPKAEHAGLPVHGADIDAGLASA